MCDQPSQPQDVFATIGRHLGINHRHEFPDFSGRPIPVLFQGEPIRELTSHRRLACDSLMIGLTIDFNISISGEPPERRVI